MVGHSEILLSKCAQFREQGEFIDVYLKVREEVFSAHRIVLAASSDYFHAMFAHGVCSLFFHDVLGFGDPKRNMEFQRVRRIGKSVRGKPRPILARFLRYQDREIVLRAGFELKGTEYMILQDFPQEIIERRRKQMPKLKEAKKRGQKVSFSKSEPDKLFIDGKFISA